jgi:hypothetical protein
MTEWSYKFSERVRDPKSEFEILKTLGKGFVLIIVVGFDLSTKLNRYNNNRSFGAVYHAREIVSGIELAIKKLTVIKCLTIFCYQQFQLFRLSNLFTPHFNSTTF